MPLSFAEHREADMQARGAAMQRAAVNPARAVDWTTIFAAATTSSADTASPSTSARSPVRCSPQPPRPHDRSKGKRTRDGSELEPARKRASQDCWSPRSSRKLLLPRRNEWLFGSRRVEGFKAPDSRRDLESLAPEVQRASPPLTNLPLSNYRTERFFGKAILHRAMDSDLSQNLWRAAMGVEDTVGHIGAHLS